MMKQAPRAMAGSLLWMLCAQFFVAEQVAARAWGGSYSFATNYVSDLGAMRSPLHGVMDASFVLQGLLIAAGAVLVRRLFSPRPAYTVALGLVVGSGVGVLVVGLVPSDTLRALHMVGASAHFLLGGAAMVTFGVLLLRDARRSPMGGWISVAAGMVVLGATALLAMQKLPVWEAVGLGVGTVERVAAYGIVLWMVGMGMQLLKRRVPNV